MNIDRKREREREGGGGNGHVFRDIKMRAESTRSYRATWLVFKVRSGASPAATKPGDKQCSDERGNRSRRRGLRVTFLHK